MGTIKKYYKKTLEYFNREKRLVVLGTTFMATLDKKVYFPKHISFYCYVESDEVLDRLEKVPRGTEIMALSYTDWGGVYKNNMLNRMDDFYLIEPEND